MTNIQALGELKRLDVLSLAEAASRTMTSTPSRLNETNEPGLGGTKVTGKCCRTEEGAAEVSSYRAAVAK